MEDDLISKKELLELTGISYGQLYRWKRKNLIPEEWFVRKSTFTGQETFFPREKMLARIQRIMDMKEDLSLDELADMFVSNPSDFAMDLDNVIQRNIVTKQGVDLYLRLHQNTKAFSVAGLFCLYVMDFMLQCGSISVDEAQLILKTMETHYQQIHGKACELWFVRKLGISICLLVPNPSDVYFDGNTKVVERIQLQTCMEQFQMVITRGM